MFKTEEVYTKEVEGTEIMIRHEKNDGWEIYYRRPGYAFQFAFGLGNDHHLQDTVWIAEDNIENYENLFD